MGNDDWKEGRISLTEAVRYCSEKGVSVSRPTMAEWAKKYNIGIQLGVKGRYVIDAYRLRVFLNSGKWFNTELSEGVGDV